jgi:hypothetical protein
MTMDFVVGSCVSWLDMMASIYVFVFLNVSYVGYESNGIWIINFRFNFLME